MDHHWLRFHKLSYFQRKEIENKRLNASLILDPVKPPPLSAKLKLYTSEKNALREMMVDSRDDSNVLDACFKL